MDNIILIASLILNALLGLKPVIMFVVKRTKTPKDDTFGDACFWYPLFDSEEINNGTNHITDMQ